jgi:hypothetical protein
MNGKSASNEKMSSAAQAKVHFSADFERAFAYAAAAEAERLFENTIFGKPCFRVIQKRHGEVITVPLIFLSAPKRSKPASSLGFWVIG